MIETFFSHINQRMTFHDVPKHQVTVSSHAVRFTFLAALGKNKGKNVCQLFHYEERLTEKLQSIYPGLFVYSLHFLDHLDQLESKRYECVMPQTDGSFYTTYAITHGKYKLENHWTVFSDLFAYYRPFKGRTAHPKSDPSYVFRMEKELKKAILELPEFRLLSITGLL